MPALWTRGAAPSLVLLLIVTGAVAAHPADAGPLAYVPSLSGGSVAVVDTDTHAVLAMPFVGFLPFGAAVSPDASRVYVTTSAGLAIMDAATYAVMTTIPTGAVSSGVAVTPDGGKVYVTNQGSDSVSVIDTLTESVVTTISVPAGPIGIAITPDGTSAYVTSLFGASHEHSTVTVISTADDAVRTSVPLGVIPFAVAVSPDGSRVYVSNFYGDDPTHASSGTVSVIDTASNSVTETLTVGSGPLNVAVSRDGARLYVANDCGTTLPCDNGRLGASMVSVVDLASGALRANIAVDHGVEGMASTPDGCELFVTNFCGADPECTGPGTVSVLSTVTDTVVASVPIGSEPLSWGNFIAPAASGCGEQDVAFDAIDCQLGVLVREVDASGADVRSRALLLAPLGRARERATDGRSASDARQRRSKLQSARRKVLAFERRLKSLVRRGRLGDGESASLLAGSSRAGRDIDFLLESTTTGCATTPSHQVSSAGSSRAAISS